MRPKPKTKGVTKARVVTSLKQGIRATLDYGARLAPFDQQTLALWAADCAERVLPNFEKYHPTDERPRRAIEVARAWARGEVKMMIGRSASVKTHAAARDAEHPAAVAAARDAEHPAAVAAARAAGHAAATAHSIRHARGAAAYAIVSRVYGTTPEQEENAVTAEREWQIAQLPNKKKRADQKRSGWMD